MLAHLLDVAVLHDLVDDELGLLDVVDDVEFADLLEVGVQRLDQEVDEGVVLVLVLGLAALALTSSSRSMPTMKYSDTYLR